MESSIVAHSSYLSGLLEDAPINLTTTDPYADYPEVSALSQSHGEADAPPPDDLADIRASITADLNAGPEAVDDATAPRWICRPVLPVAGANLAAPGSTGKTTVVLAEMVHIVCGHELYGHPIDQQGPCVLITAEDGANHGRYILREMLRDGVDCGALPERAVAVAKQEIRIVGWPRAKYGPIVNVDQFGAMRRAAVYDLLIGQLQPLQPACVALDPSVLFSPGERYGNDGDAFLASMLHETALLMGACVQMIDHVAQSVARAGIIDQYAARGGTAKTDNARLARQLVRITAEAAASMTLPRVVTPEDIAAGRVLQLHTTKSNYAPLPPPVWLRRRRFWIEHLRAPSVEEITTAAASERGEKISADVDVVVEYVRSQLSIGDGIRQSQRDIETSRPMRPDGTCISRDGTRSAIQHALATGRLVRLDLPDGERTGARKYYLAPPETT